MSEAHEIVGKLRQRLARIEHMATAIPAMNGEVPKSWPKPGSGSGEPGIVTGDWPGAGGRQPRPAAVLVPLVLHEYRKNSPTVLLTRRTDHLHDHPGQISFPGGGMEAGDASAEETAMREAEEEIGIAPERVELIGRLPDYLTGTGFRVTPIVGLLHSPIKLRIDRFEVAEAFEVPLAHFLDPANHKRHSARMKDGKTRYFHAMPYGDYFIWGATAGMLMTLYQLLAE